MDLKISSLFNQLNDSLGDTLNNDEKRNILINLLFLCKIAFKFEQTYQEIRSDAPGSEENENEYIKRGIIYLPPCSRWETILKSVMQPELKETLYNALLAVISKNPQLRGVALPDSMKVDISFQQLSYILETLSEFTSDKSSENSDLAMVYEHMMSRFAATGSNSKLGEFYTPRSVAQLLVKLIQPAQGSIYDPCCSSAGMLISAADYLDKSNAVFKLYGQEVNKDAWSLAKTNLLIHDLKANIGNEAADVFHHDLHNNLKADIVLGNPPFSNRDWERDMLINDPRWKYGLPPKNKSSFAWLQHMLHHLNEQGRMGLILSMATLSSHNAAERSIRAGLVQDDLIEMIITLPAGLFYTTRVPVSLWVLNKNKHPSCKKRILFINARKLGKSNGGFTKLDSSLQQSILTAYQAYQQGEFEDQPEFSVVVTPEDIESRDYVLMPELYIIPKKEDTLTTQELDAREKELINDLQELMCESSSVINSIFFPKRR